MRNWCWKGTNCKKKAKKKKKARSKLSELVRHKLERQDSWYCTWSVQSSILTYSACFSKFKLKLKVTRQPLLYWFSSGLRDLYFCVRGALYYIDSHQDWGTCISASAVLYHAAGPITEKSRCWKMTHFPSFPPLCRTLNKARTPRLNTTQSVLVEGHEAARL